MKLSAFTVAAILTLSCAAFAATETRQPPDLTDLGLQLEREKATVQQLRERLKAAESQFGRPATMPQGAAPVPALGSFDNAPASVVVENLEVERTQTEGRPLFRVVSRGATTLQILQTLAQTLGVSLDIHPDTGREPMLARLHLNMVNAEVAEVLEIIGGAHGLAVGLDAQGLSVGSMASTADQPLPKRLRQLAVETYQQALLRYPDSPDAPMAYMGIARYYASEGFHDAAIQTLQRVVERHRSSDVAGSAFMLMGDCQQALGQFAAARATYYRHADLHPGAPDMALTLMKIGEMWLREDKWAQSVPVFETVVRQYPQSPQAPLARMRLAEGMMRDGEYDRAIEQMQSINAGIPHGPLGDEMRLLMAECHTRMKRNVEARACYRDLVRFSTVQLIAERAYYAIGDSFLADGKLVDALQAYRGAAQRFPDGALRTLAPLYQARVHMAMGIARDADRELRRMPDAAWARPEARALVVALVQATLDTGDSARALELLYDTRWPHDMGADPALLLMEAKALLLAGSPDAALAKSRSSATLATDAATRGEACRVAAECYALRKDVVRSAMACGGRVE